MSKLLFRFLPLVLLAVAACSQSEVQTEIVNSPPPVDYSHVKITEIGINQPEWGSHLNFLKNGLTNSLVKAEALSVVEEAPSAAPDKTFALEVWVTEVVRGHGFGRAFGMALLNPYIPPKLTTVTAMVVVKDKGKNSRTLATFVIRQSADGITGVKMPRLFEELGKSVGDKVLEWSRRKQGE